MDEPKRQLVRGLTATDTTALVVGTVRSGFAIFLAAFLPLNAVRVRRELSLLGQTIEWPTSPTSTPCP